jgi:hypothetical protein
MNCDRCGQKIPMDEEMDYCGQTLCEECYVQALSPARACDPWAVRSAQVLSLMDEGYADLSDVQAMIVNILREMGGLESGVLAQRLNIPLSELQRELATLRHMEKIRGKMQHGKKIICLWET